LSGSLSGDFKINQTVPTVTIALDSATATGNLVYKITGSEAITKASGVDFSITNGTVDGTPTSTGTGGTSYLVSIKPTATGDVGVSIPVGMFTNGTFTNTGTSAGWSTAAVTLPGGGTGQALKTGATPHSGHSTIGATFDGPGLLRWSWQVSAQAGFDWLVCEVNGTEVAGISTKALAWQTQVVQIPAGAAVRWIYRKDAANVAGSDTGYIGDINFSKFAVPQTTFNDWSAANGNVAPLQAMPKLCLQAMFAWLGGLDPEATPAAGLYTPTVTNGLYKYRYRIAKGAAGLVQPEISSDLNTWSSRRMSQTIISEDTNSAVIELSTPATSPVFSRLKADQPAYTAPVPVMSYLGALLVDSYSIASAVSANGRVVVGYSNSASGNRAFRWTATGGMVDLGTLPSDTSSNASGVSADGNVVVGNSNNPSDYSRAFRWTAADGMVDLGFIPGGNYSVASGVSADGGVVVGWGRNSENGARAFRWTASAGMVDLGTLQAGTESYASSVSADGSVVVGYINNSSGVRAFRWTASGGMVDLGSLPRATYTYASGVSADGSVVVGSSGNSVTGSRAFRWSASDGMVDLGTLGGRSSGANGVSADGNVIVGESRAFFTGITRAFRWTAANGMIDLGALSGDDYSFATAVSADGSVVVGHSYYRHISSNISHAFRWR
jgi:probable HAF family extracellular repeat protein